MFSSPVIELFVFYTIILTLWEAGLNILQHQLNSKMIHPSIEKKSEIKDHKMINGTKLMLLVSTY